MEENEIKPDPKRRMIQMPYCGTPAISISISNLGRHQLNLYITDDYGYLPPGPSPESPPPEKFKG